MSDTMKIHFFSQHVILITIFTASMLISKLSFASKDIVIPVSSGDDISVEQFTAKGKYLIIWLAPEYGIRGAHRTLAQMLSKQNIEVWQTNIVESLFMPLGSTSIKNLMENMLQT